MKNIAKTIVALTGSVILTGCVVDDSYTTDYNSGTSVTYTSETTGYNRDYHKRHHKHNASYPSSGSSGSYPSGSSVPYSSQTVTETIGTPPATGGYGS